MDCSQPSSSVHGISQAKILQWVAISFSRGSSWPRDQTATFLLTNLLALALYPLFLAHGHFLHHYAQYILGAFNIHKDESSVYCLFSFLTFSPPNISYSILAQPSTHTVISCDLVLTKNFISSRILIPSIPISDNYFLSYLFHLHLPMSSPSPYFLAFSPEVTIIPDFVFLILLIFKMILSYIYIYTHIYIHTHICIAK